MIPISDSAKSARFAFLNLIIIAVNIAVFFLQLTSSDPEGFIYKYALVPANIDFSNLATLFPFISSMFLHGGFLHIASNMLFLWVFGDNVEGHYPPFVYAILYLGSGIVGALAQYILSPGSSIPMLGASGAVAGALGAYLALFPHHKIRTIIPVFGFFSIMQISAKFMLGYWIVLQIFSGAISLPGMSGAEGGVAFWAHIGGFTTGFLFAKIFPGRRDVLQRVEG